MKAIKNNIRPIQIAQPERIEDRQIIDRHEQPEHDAIIGRFCLEKDAIIG
jgi:hypothetical protein